MTESRSPALFTVEEAERTLPLVSRIVADIVEADGRLATLLPALRRARLQARMAGPDAAAPDDLERLRTEIARLSDRLEGYLRELGRIGCILHDVAGSVDFPARLDDEPIQLCWRLGEEEILWWHPPRAQAGDRRALPASLLEAASACRDGEG